LWLYLSSLLGRAGLAMYGLSLYTSPLIGLQLHTGYTYTDENLDLQWW